MATHSKRRGNRPHALGLFIAVGLIAASIGGRSQEQSAHAIGLAELRAKAADMKEELSESEVRAIYRLLDCPGAPLSAEVQSVSKHFRSARQLAVLLERRPIFRRLQDSPIGEQVEAYQSVAQESRFALRTLQAASFARISIGGFEDAVTAAGINARIAERQGSSRSWATAALSPHAAANAVRLATMLIDIGVLTPELAQRLRTEISPLKKPDPTWQTNQQVDQVAFQLRVAHEMMSQADDGAKASFRIHLSDAASSAAGSLTDAVVYKAAALLIRNAEVALTSARAVEDPLETARDLAVAARAEPRSGPWGTILADALDTACKEAQRLRDAVDQIDIMLEQLADPERNPAARRTHANGVFLYRSAAARTRMSDSGADSTAILQACVEAAAQRFDTSPVRCYGCYAQVLPADLVDRFVVATWMINCLSDAKREIDSEQRREVEAGVQASIARCREDGTTAGELVAALLEQKAIKCGLDIRISERGPFELTTAARSAARRCLAPLFERPSGDPSEGHWVASLSDPQLVFLALVVDAWFASRHDGTPSWDSPEAAELREALSLEEILPAASELAKQAGSEEGRSTMKEPFLAVQLAEWWNRVELATGSFQVGPVSK